MPDGGPMPRRYRATDRVRRWRRCRAKCPRSAGSWPGRAEVVVTVSEAALAFERQVEIFDPIASRCNLAGGRQYMQCEAAGNGHRRRIVSDRDLRGKSAHPRLAVMVAAVGEQR